MSQQLRLIGQDADDLPVISALMQDAAVKVDDTAFDAKAHRFVLLANRFCWETKQPARIRTALRVECVTRAQRRQWPSRGEQILALLAIRAEEGALVLDFAGGPSVRLEIECVDILLEDLTGPWGAKTVPRHAI